MIESIDRKKVTLEIENEKEIGYLFWRLTLIMKIFSTLFQWPLLLFVGYL